MANIGLCFWNGRRPVLITSRSNVVLPDGRTVLSVRGPDVENGIYNYAEDHSADGPDRVKSGQRISIEASTIKVVFFYRWRPKEEVARRRVREATMIARQRLSAHSADVSDSLEAGTPLDEDLAAYRTQIRQVFDDFKSAVVAILNDTLLTEDERSQAISQLSDPVWPTTTYQSNYEV